MGNYTKSVDFAAKDGYESGNPNKLVKGTEIDTEFNNIASNFTSKYDSDNLASQADAEGESEAGKLLTPVNLAHWSDYNAGIVGEIQALADPNADGLLMWDDSAAASSNVAFCTMGTGLAFDAATIKLSHLGIEALTDAGADKVLFWDDSVGATGWLTFDTGDFTISGTGIALKSTIAAQTITTLTATTITLDGANLTANADVLEWGNQALLMHNSTTYEGSEIWFNDAAPTTQGNNGDIWYEY
ncbi:MAG: hypothetical protein ACYSW8_28845 [Planctomycetota bacterium]|jgi:hypothetical protein